MCPLVANPYLPILHFLSTCNFSLLKLELRPSRRIFTYFTKNNHRRRLTSFFLCAIYFGWQGVGFFGGSSANGKGDSNYTNEGHGLWLPPVCSSENTTSQQEMSVLHVSSHQWSFLRFFVIGALL